MWFNGIIQEQHREKIISGDTRAEQVLKLESTGLLRAELKNVHRGYNMEAAILQESVKTFPRGTLTPDPHEHKGENLGLEVLPEE